MVAIQMKLSEGQSWEMREIRKLKHHFPHDPRLLVASIQPDFVVSNAQTFEGGSDPFSLSRQCRRYGRFVGIHPDTNPGGD